ncbi:partial Formamidase, partial [Burkholderiales bacterium]
GVGSKNSTYLALALQTTCHAVNHLRGPGEARDGMFKAIERIARQIAASGAFIGPRLKLVVAPEYFLSGYPLGETIPEWAERVALAPEGPEYTRLARMCQELGIYFSGNAYETDSHFPGLYFQTSFIIDDAGEVILRYRRLISMFTPSPHDVWDAYLAHYGAAALFPVADTPLGKLACIASEEILYPEIARALALNGAEVLLHSTSEVGSLRPTPKDIAKSARAFENFAYVVSANSAGVVSGDFPVASADGRSKVVDYQGEVRAEAAFGESMVAHAAIDIAALRRQRQTPGMGNTLARLRTEAFALAYARAVHPANGLLDEQGALRIPDRGQFLSTQMAVIRELTARGTFTGE